MTRVAAVAPTSSSANWRVGVLDTVLRVALAFGVVVFVPSVIVAQDSRLPGVVFATR